MISKKTYIPAKPRNKKLIGGILPTGEGIVSDGLQHSHANKPVIDLLTQLNIDVLSYLSLYQTGVEMTQQLDELGDPVFDEQGNPVMVPVLVPVKDELGNQVLDENGDPVMETVPVYAVRVSTNFFSDEEISAYGIGGGGGGGGGYDMLLSWTDYAEDKSNWVVSAALSKGLLDRIVALENGGGTGGSVAWEDITGKPSTFSPAAHGHSMSDITGLSSALAAKFDTPTGSTSQYVRGNGSLATFPTIPSIPSIIGLSELNTGTATTQRTVSASVLSQWLSGKGYLTSISTHTHAISDITNLSSTLNNLVTLDTAQTITGAKTFSAALTASVKVSTPILDLGNGWTIEAGTGKIEVKQSGTVRARFESTGFVSTGELTAYS